jgi:hypothetical protein
MNISKKYLVRRNLDSYSEMVFGKKLNKEGHEVFYPFKDKGVDLISLDAEGNVYFYQLKARNLNSSGDYWFSLIRRKIEKFGEMTKGKGFWVLCALKDKEQFDFFKVPHKIIVKWFEEAVKNNKKEKDEEFLQIMPLGNGKYEIRPKRISEKINAMDFLCKK